MFGKKNRTIISGILVGLASVYAVSEYANVPQTELNNFFITAAVFVFSIIILAITAVLLVKGLIKLKRYIFKEDQDNI